MKTKITRRVVGLLVALVLLVAASWCFLLMYSMNLYDKATVQLEQDITTFTQDDSADLASLLAQQQAVDSQFESVQRLQWAHVPSLRTKVDTNTKVSKDLTEAIRQQQEDNSANSNGSNSGSGGSSSSDNSSSSGDSNSSSSSGSSSSSSGSSDSSSSSESSSGSTSSPSESSSSSSSESPSESSSESSSESPSSGSSDSSSGSDGDQQKLQELLNRNGSTSSSSGTATGGSTGWGASRPW
ncbi:DUF6466 family protein [Pseudoscardovia suis]|uniref:Cell surface protein n=1 Tax=Pseudoscardovia suis TaxID=987063 RepID=A0A261F1B9_9BIFI|nr:DUF6466 family protein [Pseudoscardovia suis]OZG52897.1 hypothetical protein PSSU_0515 [Pseudoscardovia suis]PJJ68402.1 hypothetical protein CLV65_0978 [Pseudoscardovia suis]